MRVINENGKMRFIPETDNEKAFAKMLVSKEQIIWEDEEKKDEFIAAEADNSEEPIVVEAPKVDVKAEVAAKVAEVEKKNDTTEVKTEVAPEPQGSSNLNEVKEVKQDAAEQSKSTGDKPIDSGAVAGTTEVKQPTSTDNTVNDGSKATSQPTTTTS